MDDLIWGPDERAALDRYLTREPEPQAEPDGYDFDDPRDEIEGL